MNPNQDNGPGLNLPPQPSAEAHPTPGQIPEAGNVAAGAPSAPPPVAASWLPPSVPVQPSAPAAQASGQAAAPSASVPAIADDGDVIEKEWVLKAKQIVDRTRQDPHQQTKELHKFKAEYMQKRYNKTIKAVEE